VTGFAPDALPDPVHYYESQGLRLDGRGEWRTTSCAFHGGSDSMRINVRSGGFVCMAGCGAKGGDVLAYQMAVAGQDFVTAAQALGAWRDDGTAGASRRRPSPLSARDALSLLQREARIVAVAAAGLAGGEPLTDDDRDRLLRAASRIEFISGAAA
jgi:hypothetical protein